MRFADAHWCAHHPAGRAAPDSLGLLRGLASDAELWALASDAGAPASVRTRAMRAVARAGLDNEQADTLADWASATDLPRQLRAGAVIALKEAGEPSPAVDDDAVLVRLSERIE